MLRFAVCSIAVSSDPAEVTFC